MAGRYPLTDGVSYFPVILDVAALAVPAIAMIISVFTDIIKGRILNAVTLPAIAAGLLVSFLRHGLKGLISPAAAIAFLFIFGMFGLMGLGDIKLVMAVASSMGWLPACICLGGGALFSLMYWIITRPKEARNGLRSAALAVNVKNLALLRNGRKIPFAPFLTASFAVAAALCICKVIHY